MNELTLMVALIAFSHCLSLTCHCGNNPYEISLAYNYSYKSYVCVLLMLLAKLYPSLLFFKYQFSSVI